MKWLLVVVFAVSVQFTPGVASARDLDCRDFGTREAAQEIRNDGELQGIGDVNGLDGDGDGAACETLPSAMKYGGVGSLVSAFVALLLLTARMPGSKLNGGDLFSAILGSCFVSIPVMILLIFAPKVLPAATPAIAYFALAAGASLVVSLLYLNGSGDLRRRSST